MTSSIPNFRLYGPSPRANLVPRERLIRRLRNGTSRKLTLVSAPAGYGKSTMLSAWLHQAGLPFAWLSLDPADNFSDQFWLHFGAALQRAAGLEENPCRIGPVDDRHERAADLHGLLNILAAQKQSFVIVLDDFHSITAGEIHEDLFSLLEKLPPGLSGIHLVVATRSDPPWPLARMRATDEVLELRARELQFTREEIRAFLNDHMRLNLGNAEIAELDRRTEGWVAGLQMAALSLRDCKDVAGFFRDFSGSHRFILDFLMEEVLDRQPAEVLAFLLKTSILSQLTDALCCEITHDSRGGEMLSQLEKNNMFLVPLDERREWYRYHPLFADLLLKELQIRHPGEMTALHRTAANWFAAHGLPHEAIVHAFKTGDVRFAADHVEAFVLRTHQRGEIQMARQWLNNLPEDEVHHRPVLCIAQAWLHAAYPTVETAERYVMMAEDLLDGILPAARTVPPEEAAFVRRQIDVMQVVIARLRGEPTERQQALVQQALAQVEPEQDDAARAALLLRLGFCYLDLAKDDQADRVFRSAYQAGSDSGNLYAAHAAGYGRMVVARRQGRLEMLERICRDALAQFPDHPTGRHPLAGISLTMLGTLMYERNQAAEAAAYLDEGLLLADTLGFAELLVKGHFAAACSRMASGAPTSLPDLARFAETGNPGLQALAAALQVRLQLRSGTPADLSAAHRWAGSQTLTLQLRPTYDWEILEKLVYLRALCTMPGERPAHILSAEALSFLNEHRERLCENGWLGILIELDLVRARVYRRLGHGKEAVHALEQALVTGEMHGFFRTFLDEGEAIRDLLFRINRSSEVSAYARKLLAALDGGQTAAQKQPEALSAREQQVLEMLNTSLTVPEIAAEMHLSPTTIRTHVQNIYQKLGVHGRIEALQYAAAAALIKNPRQ